MGCRTPRDKQTVMYCGSGGGAVHEPVVTCYERCVSTDNSTQELDWGFTAGSDQTQTLAFNFPDIDANGLPWLNAITLTPTVPAEFRNPVDVDTAARFIVEGYVHPDPCADSVEMTLYKAGVGAVWVTYALDGDPANAIAPVQIGTGSSSTSLLPVIDVTGIECVWVRFYGADDVAGLTARARLDVNGGGVAPTQSFARTCLPWTQIVENWVCVDGNCTNQLGDTSLEVDLTDVTGIDCP